jgi:hypothetical protein
MADAQRSGRCGSNPVEVQVLSSAPNSPSKKLVVRPSGGSLYVSTVRPHRATNFRLKAELLTERRRLTEFSSALNTRKTYALVFQLSRNSVGSIRRRDLPVLLARVVKHN